MPDSIAKARQRVRPVGIVAAGTIIYFLTLVLVLYVLDRQIYTSQKQELIRDKYYRVFEPLDINASARTALFGSSVSERDAALSLVKRRISDDVASTTSMYRWELRDTADTIILEADNSGKIQRFNTWRNSLFVRNFRGRISQLVNSPQGTGQRGLLIGYYTSPLNYEPIEQLTARYRWYALLIIALWAAVYAVLYQNLLRPVRNVTRYLERSREAPPRLIRKARAHLESAYNQLATRALLQLIEERLSSSARPDADGQAEHRERAVADALEIAASAFGVKRIAAAEIAASPDHMAVTESFTATSQNEPVKDAELLTQARQFAGEKSQIVLPDDGAFRSNPGETGFTYFAPLGDGTFLLITGKIEAGNARMRHTMDDLERSCAVFRRGFLAYKAYRQGIFRERSEANIVLSRNLGHDLTNIIATSKLDLMAVRRLLDAPAQGTNGPRGELLRQAIEGLLENTKFLQEIVNIYRSFSNVKRPQFERRDLRGLIEEFLAAFEPSVSSRVAIQRELETPMPAPIVEPRLLKLALFNVLTNALDALRKSGTETGEAGIVTVRTRHNADIGDFRIEVEDNGPGIRDDEGRLLAPGELQAIFEYGYSTKTESSEGLGLSWVRTIMTDFHDGGVTAENLAGRGARFTLILRSMDRAEAKVAEAGVRQPSTL